MCGIVGIITLSPEKAVQLPAIQKMAGTLLHRGPDDEGYFIGPHVGLGHRRLSIIDLKGGKQPMSTPDGRYTIVYNGEIFNYRRLRSELRGQGVVFRTESDTEVLLAGFAKHGAEFLERLTGMYAFVIYDDQTGEVHLGRDPFGIKPLYVYRDEIRFLISSEIKAIRAVLAKGFEIDREALQSYLTCGYVPGRETLVQGLFRIPPGSVQTISRDGQMKETFVSEKLRPDNLLAQPKENRLLPTLISAVEESLVSDVPVGLYLSGGIDSSLIASIVSKELNQKLLSFSVRFPKDPSHDEGIFAERVAAELGLSHESIDARSEDFLDLQTLAQSLEEPMADPNAVLLGRLSGLASSRLKVVLSGEGGDELFGGYHRYFWDRTVEKYFSIPGSLRRLVERSARLMGSSRVRRRVTKLLETEGLSRPARYARWFSPFCRNEWENLLLERPGTSRVDLLFSEAFGQAASLPFASQGQWVDLVTYLRDDLLAKADKMSMVHSLEVRVPYLQTGVVEAAFALDEDERIGRGTKPALRSLLRKYLPPEIVDRKKQGFEVPLGRWFKGPLKPLLDRYLSENVVRERALFRREIVSKIRQEHERGESDRGMALFSLCLLEAWCREFLS